MSLWSLAGLFFLTLYGLAVFGVFQFLDRLRHREILKMVSVYSPQRLSTHKRILLLVNPFSGTKTALTIMDKIVKPMFERANILYDIVETTSATHAYEVCVSLTKTELLCH